MPAGLLPLFPLQVVVFPRTPLPLHIFEERYKKMVGEAIHDRSEFGIVLAKDEGIVNAGCTVVVEKVLKEYPDGRMDILTSGRRRFEILFLNEEREYLRGEVEYFDDDDQEPVTEEMRRQVLEQYRALLETGETPGYGQPDLKDEQLSFQLAQGIPDTDFLNLLLRTRSEAERLRELREFLTEFIPRQQQIVRMKKAAPQNGFGGKRGAT
ncbi:MAG TPA: LON peptidase substrate-binding domain-containing protein [Bryobacteraceae bacterium]|nr:LON peptidase substrate-binding domain-containing protein [Bryobacteraceae bacterium]